MFKTFGAYANVRTKLRKAKAYLFKATKNWKGLNHSSI